jgi:hypothetical protein
MYSLLSSSAVTPASSLTKFFSFRFRSSAAVFSQTQLKF